MVNTASVAPNGDVVSDPVPLIGGSATVTEAGRSNLSPLATGPNGAPGAVIELPVAGFNPSAIYGSLAVFASGGATVERYGSIYTSAAGAQTFVVQVPPLAAGAAILTLHNLGSGYRSDPIDLQIAPAAPVNGSATENIDATLDLATAMLAALDTKLAGTGTGADSADSAVAAGQPFIDTVRANVAVMVGGGRAEDDAALKGPASRIVASGVANLLADVHAELTTGSAYVARQQGSCNNFLDRADKGIEMVGNLTDLAGYDPPGGDTVADMHSYAFGEWWAWVKRTTLGMRPSAATPETACGSTRSTGWATACPFPITTSSSPPPPARSPSTTTPARRPR